MQTKKNEEEIKEGFYVCPDGQIVEVVFNYKISPYLLNGGQRYLVYSVDGDIYFPFNYQIKKIFGGFERISR